MGALVIYNTFIIIIIIIIIFIIIVVTSVVCPYRYGTSRQNRN